MARWKIVDDFLNKTLVWYGLINMDFFHVQRYGILSGLVSKLIFKYRSLCERYQVIQSGSKSWLSCLLSNSVPSYYSMGWLENFRKMQEICRTSSGFLPSKQDQWYPSSFHWFEKQHDKMIRKPVGGFCDILNKLPFGIPFGYWSSPKVRWGNDPNVCQAAGSCWVPLCRSPVALYTTLKWDERWGNWQMVDRKQIITWVWLVG